MRSSVGPRSIKQQGQVLVAFALVMAGFMLTLFAATLDLQALAVAYNRADTTALLGAQAGASGVSIAGIYSLPASGGPIPLDQTRVNANCAALIPSPPQRGFVSLTCAVLKAPNGSDYVRATVVWKSLFPVPLPGFNAKNLTLIRNGYPGYGCSNGANGFVPFNPATGGCK